MRRAAARAWAVFDGDKMWSLDFFRTRTSAQIYAGRRRMGGADYRNALLVSGVPSHVGDVEEFSFFAKRAGRHVWKVVKRNHPNFRLVRVKVSP